MTASSATHSFRATDALRRASIVGLALATAYLHSTLGGLLFTLNAIGYVAGAAAMIVPLEMVTRYRWLVRIGLAVYAAGTIIAWAIQGPFYSTAYIAKSLELALIFLLVVDFARSDGNPIALIRREIRAGLAAVRGRASRSVTALALAVLAIGVAACSDSSRGGAAPTSIDWDALAIDANHLMFSPTELTAPANKPFQIVFNSQESAPHNVAIYRDASAAHKVFGEAPFNGPRVVIYNVPALAAGRYFFRCDLHPNMTGTLTVVSTDSADEP